MKLRVAIFFVSVFILIGCGHSTKTTEPVKANWISESDKIAERFTHALAANRPEVGSELGYHQYDHLGLLLDSKTEERDRAILIEWIKILDSETSKTQDLELKTDIEVLQSWIRNQIANSDAYRKENEVEFLSGTRIVYQSLQFLVGEQASVESKKAAVDRFRIYVHGDSAHKPLLEAMQELYLSKVKEYAGKKMLMPFKGLVERYLADSTAILSGVQDLLISSGRSDWENDYKLFKNQVQAYDYFVKTEILPESRLDARLPKHIYSQILKNRGIESTPEKLISTGLTDYKKIYLEFKIKAKDVAKIHKLKNAKPADVIRFLKSKPVTSSAELEKLYKEVDQRLDKIMREHNLISVPSTPLRIRMAGDAESRMVPVPHMNAPPLVNNKGERPEFVIPTATKGFPFDDFLSRYSAIVLTAHEGRPGHDMQFSQMLDQGMSVIRSRYAANNVNIEGWALYAEDLIYPYISPEEQLFALQTRLWRVARMFLDPQLQLGKIKDQKVIDVFTKELGVSETMANLELRRYKFEDIGQAPSYYEGYLLVKKMKTDMQAQQGAKFNLKCFNDRLLSFGLLPLSISAERMKQNVICPVQ